MIPTSLPDNICLDLPPCWDFNPPFDIGYGISNTPRQITPLAQSPKSVTSSSPWIFSFHVL